MSERDPIDPGLAELFRRESLPEPPELARARVRARLEGVIPALGGEPPSDTMTSLAHGGALGAKAVALAAATFVAGGVLGGVVVAAWRPPSAPRIAYVERTSPAPSPTTAIAAAEPPVVAPVASTAPVAEAPRGVLRPPDAGDALAAERLLIDDARSRLVSGDPQAALARLQEHARRFPRGRLAEDREALAVQALVQSGQYDAARRRARELRSRWPESVYLPAVDTTLRSIP
jgi:hypothetical protein